MKDTKQDSGLDPMSPAANDIGPKLSA